MPWTREEKTFCVTTYLETKSFKIVSKYMQPVNMIMIFYWHKKLKKTCMSWKLILEQFSKILI